ncbi:MAG: GNAT family N-acetyltransferase [Woeseiaceae bacterium]|nr:GNAT family N-acetyltransferase [Woeseiaceae bacterium]
MTLTEGLKVSVEPARNRSDIARLWQDLESRAEGPFFLSWDWIGSWLSALPQHIVPSLLCVSTGDRTVGLGILTRTDQRRHGVIHSQVLSLNQSGDAELDGIAIEHNDILVEHGLEADVTAAALAWLAREYRRWDEFNVSWATTEVASRMTAARGPMPAPRAVDERPYFIVGLDEVRRSGGDYLATLSRNTRYQIRRAMKRYAEAGPVELSRAASIDEALEMLEQLRSLHEEHWKKRGEPGAFHDEFRQSFHRQLVSSCFASGGVDLLRVSAGGEPFGYLYNFFHRGVVYNYQSGFRYTDDAKLKPGLVSHAVAIQDYLDRDVVAYDFLMGRHRYKQSLANRTGAMARLIFQQPRLRFRLENLMRDIKTRIQGS